MYVCIYIYVDTYIYIYHDLQKFDHEQSNAFQPNLGGGPCGLKFLK